MKPDYTWNPTSPEELFGLYCNPDGPGDVVFLKASQDAIGNLVWNYASTSDSIAQALEEFHRVVMSKKTSSVRKDYERELRELVRELANHINFCPRCDINKNVECNHDQACPIGMILSSNE